jgi:hypothetical protein
MFCVVGKDKYTNQTQKQVRKNYKERTIEGIQEKRNLAERTDVCVLYCRGKSDMSVEDMKVHNG